MESDFAGRVLDNAITCSDKYCYNNGADRDRTGDLLLAKHMV